MKEEYRFIADSNELHIGRMRPPRILSMHELPLEDPKDPDVTRPANVVGAQAYLINGELAECMFLGNDLVNLSTPQGREKAALMIAGHRMVLPDLYVAFGPAINMKATKMSEATYRDGRAPEMEGYKFPLFADNPTIPVVEPDPRFSGFYVARKSLPAYGLLSLKTSDGRNNIEKIMESRLKAPGGEQQLLSYAKQASLYLPNPVTFV